MKPEDLGACFERNIHRVIVEANQDHPAIAKKETGKLVGLPRVRSLECCVCGESTRGRQWWNRDTGYGVCVPCVAFVRSHGETDEQVLENYGQEGIHWGVDENPEIREELARALSPAVHITLSGRNAEPLAIRAVYANGEQIGIVRQSREDNLWIADDMAGHCHGVTYTTDWNAAKQLALGLGMRPE